MAFAEDLDAFLADFGVPVTFEGAPTGTLGILEFHDDAVLEDGGRAGVLGRMRGLYVKTTVADLLASGQAITVDGTAYTVRDPKAWQDGAFSLVALRG